MSVIISIPIAARRAFRPVATATFCSSSPKKKQKQLILYSKAGCCLCDGLKEKLNAAFSLSGPHPIQLQVRNIMENPEWERLYQYEIPVLAKLLPDGTEKHFQDYLPVLVWNSSRRKLPLHWKDNGCCSAHFRPKAKKCGEYLPLEG